LIVEDTHTSYSRELGNPSRYSFMSYSKALIDGINSRFPSVRASQNVLNKVVWSMGFYESIVSFHVDRRKCFVSSPTSNDGVSLDARDFRFHQSAASRIESFGGSLTSRLARVPGLMHAFGKVFRAMTGVVMKWQSRRLRAYFR
jgi:hypothetical protein